jgi:hypothetical protein
MDYLVPAAAKGFGRGRRQDAPALFVEAFRCGIPLALQRRLGVISGIRLFHAGSPVSRKSAV